MFGLLLFGLLLFGLLLFGHGLLLLFLGLFLLLFRLFLFFRFRLGQQTACETHVVLGVGVLGLDGQDFVVGVDSLAILALQQPGVAEVVTGIHPYCIPVHRREGGLGFGVTAGSVQGYAAPVGVLEAGGGLLVLAVTVKLGGLLFTVFEPGRVARSGTEQGEGQE